MRRDSPSASQPGMILLRATRSIRNPTSRGCARALLEVRRDPDRHHARRRRRTDLRRLPPRAESRRRARRPSRRPERAAKIRTLSSALDASDASSQGLDSNERRRDEILVAVMKKFRAGTAQQLRDSLFNSLKAEMSTNKQADQDSKEFWQKAKERSKEVDKWPAWRRLETTHRRDSEKSSDEEDGSSKSDKKDETQADR
jgi:hypothetical protein